MATGNSSNVVSVSGNVQALSNAIAVAIMSQQAAAASSPSATATGGPASVRSGADATQPPTNSAGNQSQSQRYRPKHV